jgi:hypothetical protein
MRVAIGILGRAVFWFGLWWIVLHAASQYWASHQWFKLLLSVVLFPFTYFVHPWQVDGMWLVFMISMVGYAASVFIGRMRPV